MTWRDYTAIRLRYIREGSTYLPAQREVIRKLLRSGGIWKHDALVRELCDRTGITRSSAEQHITATLESMTEKGTIVCVSPGFYCVR